MRTWPPYSPDDEDDPIPDDEFDQLLVVHGLAVGPYTSHAAVLAELTHLGELRSSYRRSRWAITESWIVTIGMFVVMLVTRWWLLALPIAAFTLLAVHQMGVRDVSALRGRELDADIADAQKRLQGLLKGEGR